MESFDTDLIQMFVAESIDMIDEAEPILIQLAEKMANGTAEDRIDDINCIFRLFHSIKGTAGFLQYHNISKLTHEAETLLDHVRKDLLEFSDALSDDLVVVCDLLRKMMRTVGESLVDEGMEPQVEELIVVLQGYCAGMDDEPEKADLVLPELPREAAVHGDEPEELFFEEKTPLSESAKAEALISAMDDEVESPEEAPAETFDPASDEMVRIYVQDSAEVLEQAEHVLIELERGPDNAEELIQKAFRLFHTFKGNSGLMCYEDCERLSHSAEAVLDAMRAGDVQPGSELMRLLLSVIDTFKSAVADIDDGGRGAIAGRIGLSDLLEKFLPKKSSPAVVEKAVDKSSSAAGKSNRGGEKAGTGGMQKSIRVNVDKLEHLNNLIGELVISSAMVIGNRDLAGLRLEHFRRAAHRLKLITSELQDISMSLRMVPIENTLKKLIRLSHDVSSRTEKKVDLKLVGTGTEVDRTVAEMIADPLVHIVRNSIDHGIELPAKRRALGKPEVGQVTVEARHQSGEVWVLVRDDGKGLDREKIVERGVERGLIREEDVAHLTDNQVFELIFEPGFSTAEIVTDVSGRGVGMDVVKKNIEKLNGRVEVASVAGQWTMMTIRIPLTLAIINGMIVRVGKEDCIIPLLAIKESLKPTPEMINTVVGRGETVYLRGEVLPLFRLADIFTIPGAVQRPEDGIVVVVESSGRKTALLVDALLGQQQTVIKSLGETFRHIRGLAGASIMADGRIALIIDIDGVVRLATA